MTLLRWLTFLLESQTVILIVLLFWVSFFLSLTQVFVLQWLSLHWELLIMLLSQVPLTFTMETLPSNSQWDAWLHCIVYDYSCADWDGLHDHLRDNPWEDIFKLASAVASIFCECIQVGINVYIPHRKYWYLRMLGKCLQLQTTALLVFVLLLGESLMKNL